MDFKVNYELCRQPLGRTVSIDCLLDSPNFQATPSRATGLAVPSQSHMTWILGKQTGYLCLEACPNE